MPGQHDTDRLYGMDPMDEETHATIMRINDGKGSPEDFRHFNRHIRDKCSQIRRLRPKLPVHGELTED